MGENRGWLLSFVRSEEKGSLQGAEQRSFLASKPLRTEKPNREKGKTHGGREKKRIDNRRIGKKGKEEESVHEEKNRAIHEREVSFLQRPGESVTIGEPERRWHVEQILKEKRMGGGGKRKIAEKVLQQSVHLK